MRVSLIASLVADHQSLIANSQSRSLTHTAPPKTPSSTFTDQALIPVYVVGDPALTSVVEVVEAGVTLVLVTIMVPAAVVVVLGALGGWTMYEDQNVAAVDKTSYHLQHEKALPYAMSCQLHITIPEMYFVCYDQAEGVYELYSYLQMRPFYLYILPDTTTAIPLSTITSLYLHPPLSFRATPIPWINLPPVTIYSIPVYPITLVYLFLVHFYLVDHYYYSHSVIMS